MNMNILHEHNIPNIPGTEHCGAHIPNANTVHIDYELEFYV
jgi:hypothetical protein